MVDFLGRFFASFLGRWFGGQDSGEIPALQMAVDVTAPTPTANVQAQVGEKASGGRADTGLFFVPDPVRASIRAEAPLPVAEIHAAVLDVPLRGLPAIPGFEPAETWEPLVARAFWTPPLPAAQIQATPIRTGRIIYYMPDPQFDVEQVHVVPLAVLGGPGLPEAEIQAQAYGHIDDDEIAAILAAILAEEEAA